LEQDFENWIEAFWPAFEAKFGLHSEGGDEDLPRYDVITIDGVDGERSAAAQTAKYDKEHSNARAVPTAAKPYLASVKVVRELFSASADRSCVHVEFDISGSSVQYKTGDHLGVFAENGKDIIKRVAKALKCDLNMVFRLVKPIDAPASLAESFSTPITVGDAIARYADVLTPPRKQALAALASVATGKDATKLAFLASPAGKDEFAKYITKPHRSLLEVMEDYPSVVPDVGLFFGAIAPRLAPRYYSISSSPAANKNIVTATVAVVKEKVATGRMHEGVASTFLQRAAEGQKIPIFVRTSTFRLPENSEAPVIMIGPGTGYAPFRGFLQERTVLKASGAKLGPALLFFGCRNSANDFIYADEMQLALSEGVITSLDVAFSRDGPKKVYVQDKIIDKASTVYPIVKGTVGKNEGAVYICGDAKNMAKDVNKALLSVLMREGDYAAHEAEEILRRLKAEFRYHQDVW
jgi:NADPH-ferrihemoprotein reductase